jgi:hypothetical protein
MIIILSKPATPEDIQKASEEYKNYIKVTMDIEKGIVSIGGEYHYDAEQQLLAKGSNQQDIWGGGVDLLTKSIDTNAMINVRVKQNYSTEICDETVKKRFVDLVKKYLPNYVEQS